MKVLVAAVALLSLNACASRYVGTPFAAPENPISSVGVVDDALPDSAIAAEAASTLGNFGLIGALIDAGVQSSRKSRVNDALETVEYDAEANFEKFLIDALAEKNIQATMVGSEDRGKREFLEEYPAAPEGAQALLDFSVDAYGYANAGNKLWRPHVTANVKLVDAVTGETLMENRIVYNPINPQAGVVTIAPDFDYVFQNREDMVTQPERLAEGIDVALKEVVATSLRLMQ